MYMFLDPEYIQYINNKDVTKAKQYINWFDEEYNVFDRPKYLTTTQLLDRLDDHGDKSIKDEIMRRCSDPVVEFKMCKKDYDKTRKHMIRMLSKIYLKNI